MILRSMAIFLALICFSGLISYNAVAANEPPPAAVFDRVIPSVDFNNIAIGDALDILRDASRSNIVVRDKAIAAAGITLGNITLSEKNAKVSDLLRRITDQAGDGKLDMTLDDNVCTISTTESIKAATTQPTHAPFPPGANKELVASLGRRVPASNFNRVSFGNVIDFLRDTTNAKIVVDWDSLKSAGIGEKTEVSESARNVKLSALLDIILGQAADGKLVYSIKGDSIVIETREQLEKDSPTTKPAN